MDKIEIFQLIKKLCEAFGPSGFEDEVRDLIIKEMERYVDELKIDRWGNIIGVKYGKGIGKFMIAAHMDEIGLIIDNIDRHGFLRFRQIGGWSELSLIGQRVVIKCRDGKKVRGVIGVKPPHVTPSGEERKAPEIKDMFIDIGASSDKEVREKYNIDIGCVAILDREVVMLNEDVITGKAFDNRVGVAIMLTSLKELKSHEVDIYFVATVQEEIGLKGAMMTAERIEPDAAIALDTTIASDVPGIPEREQVIKLGKGPAIKVMDGGRAGMFISHSVLREYLINIAKEENIPYQLEVLLGGTTDATAIAVRRGGIPAITISTPARYVHSPIEVINLNDVVNAIKLLTKAIEKANTKLIENLREKKLK